MSLNGTCPSCGFHADLEAFLQEGELAQEDRVALALPSGLATEIEQYIRLFARPGKRVTSRRRRTILAELLPHIQAGKLEFDRQTWPAPVEYWREAITKMVETRDKLDLPLPNNNYLYRVVSGLSKRADAQAEQNRLTRGRGETPTGRPAVSVAPASSRPAGRDAGATRTQDGTRAGLKSLHEVLAGTPLPTNGENHGS